MQSSSIKNRPEVTVLCGLPGSGKTAMAEEIANDNPNIVMVSYSKIAGSSIDKLTYSWVYDVMEYMVMRAIQKGINVIVDDLNLSQKARDRWAALAKLYGADINYIKMPTSLTNCLKHVSFAERDSVRKMYEEYKDFLTAEEEEEEEEEITINC